MSNLKLEESIVSVAWLHENLLAANLVVLDATFPKATNTSEASSEEFQIPNTRFFDIKNKFSDLNGNFPSTFPSANQFEKSARELGINKDTAIVVYDTKGIYSSARAWWLFKAFGHKNVAVLNGGFPEWKRKELPTEKKQSHIVTTGNFDANPHPKTFGTEYMLFFEDILKIQEDENYTILDARSSGRFLGIAPEPREGLRSGRIPNSINLPFEDILRNQKLLPKDELKKAFESVTHEKANLVFSCGSGITACVLALGADILGYKNTAVYDGSWTEYGSLIAKEETMHWTKAELVAYTLLYAANSNMDEDNKERNMIIDRVDMQTFQKIHDEFDADNDYQSIQKIEAGLREHNYSQDGIDELLAEIKMLFFSDGEFDIMERMMYRSLKKIWS